MGKYIEYQRFLTIDDAASLIDLLDANKIPFKVDDSAMRFDLAATSLNPLESGIVVQIREVDKDKADGLNDKKEELPGKDHYMYSLSDTDIMDAVVNRDEWTEEERALAREIFKQRHLTLTAETIKSSRKEKVETEKKEVQKQKSIIRGGTSFFLWIGILSALNLIVLLIHQNVQFIVGLGINYFILGFMEGIRQATGVNLSLLGYALAFICSGLFILIWKKSRQENKTVYLIGLILYALDALIFAFAKEWLSFGFHIFAISMLYAGYDALLKKIRETEQK